MVIKRGLLVIGATTEADSCCMVFKFRSLTVCFLFHRDVLRYRTNQLIRRIPKLEHDSYFPLPTIVVRL